MLFNKRGHLSFAEIAAAYFEVRGTTLKGIVTDKNRCAKHLLPLCGKLTVSEITPQVVEQLRKSLDGRKPGTVWNVLELLRRIINFGHRTNRCPALAFNIEMPTRDNAVIEYLKPEEAQRFLTILQTWPVRDVARMLQLAFFTGMRRGEIFKLEERDIDFHMKLIRIRAPKGGKSMSIGLNGVAEQIIREQLQWRDEYFPGKTGGLRKDCSSVDSIHKAAALPPRFRPFHGLRHHFAVTLANSGAFTLDMIA